MKPSRPCAQPERRKAVIRLEPRRLLGCDVRRGSEANRDQTREPGGWLAHSSVVPRSGRLGSRGARRARRDGAGRSHPTPMRMRKFRTACFADFLGDAGRDSQGASLGAAQKRPVFARCCLSVKLAFLNFLEKPNGFEGVSALARIIRAGRVEREERRCFQRRQEGPIPELSVRA